MSSQQQKEINFLIESSTPLTSIFTIKIKSSRTILDLLKKISKKVNIPIEYITLYKTQPSRSNENGTTFRAEEFRIDYQPTILQPIPDTGKNDIEVRILVQDQELKRTEESRLKWQSQTLKQIGLTTDQTLNLSLRPMRGDHIHSLVSFYVEQDEIDVKTGKIIQSKNKNPALNIQLDRPNQEYIFELKHISQLFPHFGIHGGGQLADFSMSLAHIHPGTSWTDFHETEGLGGNIDKFLEQVGIWIWEKKSKRYPSHGPLFPLLEEKNVIFDFPLTSQFRDGRRLASTFEIPKNQTDQPVSASSWSGSQKLKVSNFTCGMCK